MERDTLLAITLIGMVDFNSHAHVERDCAVDKIGLYQWISTHTLTWSVTDTEDNGLSFKNISTHTLTWSVTWIKNILSLSFLFQLTRSRGA